MPNLQFYEGHSSSVTSHDYNGDGFLKFSTYLLSPPPLNKSLVLAMNSVKSIITIEGQIVRAA